MKSLHLYLFAIVLACLNAFTANSAFATNDQNAAVVKLRTSCTENNAAMDNCFSSIADLTTWLTQTRRPNSTQPLKVEFGPGTFTEPLIITCDTTTNFTGFISFEGAGSGQTILKSLTFTTPLSVRYCTEMNFAHLSIIGTRYAAIKWDGGGNSKWTDIVANGIARGWYEGVCGTTRGNHYWYSSKLSSSAASVGVGVADTYRASCDESWFFGSEVNVSVAASFSTNGAAVSAQSTGIIHVYGSVLRVVVNGQHNVYAASTGSGGGGMIHIHGTGIDVTSETGANIAALSAYPGGMIHANSTAYNLQTSGTKTRILDNGGMIMAPYLWQQDTMPPDIISVNGADQVVVTNTLDGYPHLLVYATSCASKWYDTVTRACN